MASPADVIAGLAHAGLDATGVNQVVQYLTTGVWPDGLTPQAQAVAQWLPPSGLSAAGVDQALTYLRTGQAPADVSSVDERAQVLGLQSAPGAPPPQVSNLTSAQQSARAILSSTLGQWNLGSLASTAWDLFVSGMPLEQVYLEIRKTPEWKAEFGVIDELAAKGRALSESEVVGLRRTYAQVMRSAGLPETFFDQSSDFDALIGGEVSPSELNSRVQLAATAAYKAPAEVRAELSRLYGVSGGELVAFFLDPDRALPLIEQRFTAAQVGSAAKRAGFGALTQGEAERLAALGVDERQAEQGFGLLSRSSELMAGLPGDSGEAAISRETQLGAAFGGDAKAQAEVQRRGERRKAVFDSGGGFATDRQGVSGLGSSS